MSATPLTYQLPDHLSSDQFIKQLHTKLSFVVAAQYPLVKTFYDSFDWRLYHASMVLEFNQSESVGVLSLMNIHHPQVLMTMELERMPTFAVDFPQPDFMQQLQLVLEMRALLPVMQLNGDYALVNILNSDQKTVLRLVIENYATLPGRIRIQTIKGYDKHVLALILLLQTEFALQAVDEPLLIEACHAQRKKIGGFSSKLKLRLEPEMRTDDVCRYIYINLLERMAQTEQGCIDNIDSEFLHDFRVAVRRTRAGLSQIKQVFPKQSMGQFIEFFSWLGHITSGVRDIDVYLLNYESYKNSLPEAYREDLEPLQQLLLSKQRRAYEQLARHLTGSVYQDGIEEWRDFLETPIELYEMDIAASLPIKHYADQRLWKVYKRLLREAGNIDPQSPVEALHGLRKTAKKLRYLMEFFQTLYSGTRIKLLLKALKTIQEVLGRIQDLEVQKLALKRFREELRKLNTPEQTLLAIDALINELDRRKNAARFTYTESYEVFSQKKNQQAFRELFASGTQTQT